MKNVTFSAQDDLISMARELAQARGTTLNEEFRLWLQRYISNQGQDEKQASTRRIIDAITTPAAGEAGFVPLEQRYAPAGTLMREALNEREARMLKRLDANMVNIANTP
jgi:hypothetical protein